MPGRVVTEYRWGGRGNFTFMRHTFLVVPGKLVKIGGAQLYGSYRKIKTGVSLSGPPCMFTVASQRAIAPSIVLRPLDCSQTKMIVRTIETVIQPFQRTFYILTNSVTTTAAPSVENKSRCELQTDRQRHGHHFKPLLTCESRVNVGTSGRPPSAHNVERRLLTVSHWDKHSSTPLTTLLRDERFLTDSDRASAYTAFVALGYRNVIYFFIKLADIKYGRSQSHRQSRDGRGSC